MKDVKIEVLFDSSITVADAAWQCGGDDCFMPEPKPDPEPPVK